jgi:excisionase family DNA binding protein
MGHTIPRDNRQDKILSLIDHLFDIGRALAKEWTIIRLEHQANDQAEASARIAVTPAPVLSDKRELTVKELAAIWGVSTRSIYEWTTTGWLPFKKVGRLLRFDWIEADQWAKQHREAIGKARLRVVK